MDKFYAYIPQDDAWYPQSESFFRQIWSLCLDTPNEVLTFPRGLYLHGKDFRPGRCLIAVPSCFSLYEECDF